MTIEKKLQFLTDRAKDEQVFYNYDEKMQFIGGKLNFLDGLAWKKCNFSINELQECKFGLTKEWTFTPEEKVILGSLEEDYQWITRDKSGALYVYYRKPFKTGDYWDSNYDNDEITLFKHLFDAIHCTDDEPCEFRKYL